MLIMIKANSITKNTSYLTLALAMQKVISFTYFTLLARNLGPENLGKYYFAISFTTIFALIIDLGLMNVLTREVAKKKDQAQRYLGNILTLKTPLLVLCLLSVFVVINLLGYDDITKQLVYISAIAMALDSFTTTFFAVTRSFHNLKYESIGAIGFQAIVMILGLSALYSGMGLKWIMSAMLAGSLTNFIYSWYVVKIKLGLQIKLQYNKDLAITIIKIAIPFGIYILFNRTFLHIDSVLLSLLAGDKEVGLYQIAFKIIFALQFIPLAFTASFYPAMSFYWKNNKQQLVTSFERALKYLLIISLPIAAGVFSIADKVVLLFKEQFIESTLPLQIIIISAVFVFINFPIGSFLNACDRQKRNTINMGIVLAISIAMNTILIPKYQAVGASITVLFANMVMTILGLYYVTKIIRFRHGQIIKTALKTITSAAIMGLAVFYLKEHINIFIVIMCGGVSYFALLFLFKAFIPKDVVLVYNLLANKKEFDK
jgi:O-antigen/teichoic acid export membrane protein